MYISPVSVHMLQHVKCGHADAHVLARFIPENSAGTPSDGVKRAGSACLYKTYIRGNNDQLYDGPHNPSRTTKETCELDTEG